MLKLCTVSNDNLKPAVPDRVCQAVRNGGVGDENVNVLKVADLDRRAAVELG